MNTFHFCVDAAAGAGLDLLLIGGHAVNARGYERTTLDVDFLIPAHQLDQWKQIFLREKIQLIHETEAFAQFMPPSSEGFRVDLMLVGEPTFSKFLAESECLYYGGRTVRVAGVLHLIALKLHATRTWSRAVQGKDFYDIVNLIHINKVDIHSAGFTEILERYAKPSIKERLLSELSREF